MIYVPDLNYACYVVRDTNTIRAYETMPYHNTEVEYRDYYINSNYLYQDGTQSFSNYSTLPTCLDNDVITDNYIYRNDLSDILIIFVIIVGFVYFFISKLVKALFKF